MHRLTARQTCFKLLVGGGIHVKSYGERSAEEGQRFAETVGCVETEFGEQGQIGLEKRRGMLGFTCVGLS